MCTINVQQNRNIEADPHSASQCLTVPHSTSLSVHRRSNANPNRNFIVDFSFFPSANEGARLAIGFKFSNQK